MQKQLLNGKRDWVVSAVTVGWLARWRRDIAVRLMRCVFDEMGASEGLCMVSSLQGMEQDASVTAWIAKQCPRDLRQDACATFVEGRHYESGRGWLGCGIVGALCLCCIANIHGIPSVITRRTSRSATMWGAVAAFAAFRP
uniref:Uncharacterized protein n=1 Tax=viral metagenome TaxID=1070528 RepID=A0A6C0KB84_9ZZZZ